MVKKYRKNPKSAKFLVSRYRKKRRWYKKVRIELSVIMLDFLNWKHRDNLNVELDGNRLILTKKEREPKATGKEKIKC